MEGYQLICSWLSSLNTTTATTTAEATTDIALGATNGTSTLLVCLFSLFALIPLFPPFLPPFPPFPHFAFCLSYLTLTLSFFFLAFCSIVLLLPFLPSCFPPSFSVAEPLDVWEVFRFFEAFSSSTPQHTTILPTSRLQSALYSSRTKV